MSTDTPRVALVAENASLKFGGESNLAYHYFKLLRRRGVDAYLVVHERNADELRELLRDDFDRVRMAADTRLARFLWSALPSMPDQVRAQTLSPVVGLQTQWLQRKIIAELIQQGRIDLIHQVAPVSPKMPSLLHGMGVPLVVGPMSGGMDYPPAFVDMQSKASRAVESAGRQIAEVLNWVFPGKRRADVLVVANAQTRNALPTNFRGQVVELVEIGVDLEVWKEPSAGRPARADDEVRFAYLGRLVDWKAVDLLIRAFQQVAGQAPKARLEIIGSGRMEADLKRLTGELRLDDRVTFSGWMTPQEAAQRFLVSDVLVLPSLRECGGIVMLEAMALGLPVLATNWGGPGAYLDDEIALRVEPSSREGFVEGLAEAMLKLVRQPELRKKMGETAQRRVRETVFNWDHKVDRMIEIYRAAVGRTSAPASARAPGAAPGSDSDGPGRRAVAAHTGS
jgi:glycosyltransferase involved in cell wall biosynthesis